MEGAWSVFTIIKESKSSHTQMISLLLFETAAAVYGVLIFMYLSLFCFVRHNRLL